ncbi:MAG: SAM-dependent methyltransferase [Burkholderiales bacterium]
MATTFLCFATLLLPASPVLSQDPGVVEDVPYLATPQVTVDEMLRLAGVGPGDVVYDLGSGDGRVVITAARKFGARAVGVEIDLALVAQSRANAARAGVADRTRILQQDLFATDLGEATVITLYLAPHLNLRLRPKLLGLAPGTRIVSHGADLGDWRPDRRTAIRKDVLLWYVPAQLAGRWRARIAPLPGERYLELVFSQRYQELSADARLDGLPTQVWEARLEGDNLRFALVDATEPGEETVLYFSGKVRGDTIEGEVARDVGIARRLAGWRAERLGR